MSAPSLMSKLGGEYNNPSQTMGVEGIGRSTAKQERYSRAMMETTDGDGVGRG